MKEFSSILTHYSYWCSEKGYRLLSYVSFQRKYTPYGKTLYQIL